MGKIDSGEANRIINEAFELCEKSKQDLRAIHANEVEKLTKAYKDYIKDLKAQHERVKEEMRVNNKEYVGKIEAQYKQHIENLTKLHQAAIDSYEKNIQKKDQLHENYINKLKAIYSERDAKLKIEFSKLADGNDSAAHIFRNLLTKWPE